MTGEGEGIPDERANSETGSSLDITVSSGLFYKAQMEEMPRCYIGIFNTGLSIAPLTLCLYLIMLCEFGIFPSSIEMERELLRCVCINYYC